MIITCPSCGTRYRQPQAAAESPVNCSCSRCDAVFPSRTRTPTPSVSLSDAAGYDAAQASVDPVLAIGVNLEPDPPPMAAPMVIPEDGPVPGNPVGLADLPIGMDDPTLASKIQRKGFTTDVQEAVLTYSSVAAEEPVESEEPEEVTEPPAETAEDKKPATAGPEPQRHKPPRDTRPGFGAFMMVTGLPTAMAAGAWQLATMFGEDPVIWTTPAGVLGLLFSWLWVRWKYREN